MSYQSGNYPRTNHYLYDVKEVRNTDKRLKTMIFLTTVNMQRPTVLLVQT